MRPYSAGVCRIEVYSMEQMDIMEPALGVSAIWYKPIG